MIQVDGVVTGIAVDVQDGLVGELNRLEAVDADQAMGLGVQ